MTPEGVDIYAQTPNPRFSLRYTSADYYVHDVHFYNYVIDVPIFLVKTQINQENPSIEVIKSPIEV